MHTSGCLPFTPQQIWCICDVKAIVIYWPSIWMEESLYSENDLFLSCFCNHYPFRCDMWLMKGFKANLNECVFSVQISDSGYQTAWPEWIAGKQGVSSRGANAKSTSSLQSCKSDWLLCWWRSKAISLWIHATWLSWRSFIWYFPNFLGNLLLLNMLLLCARSCNLFMHNKVLRIVTGVSVFLLQTWCPRENL